MQRKLTITVDADVYEGRPPRPHRHRRINRFLNDLARQPVATSDLVAGYAAMAADEAREHETEAWSAALIGDLATGPRGD